MLEHFRVLTVSTLELQVAHQTENKIRTIKRVWGAGWFNW